MVLRYVAILQVSIHNRTLDVNIIKYWYELFHSISYIAIIYQILFSIHVTSLSSSRTTDRRIARFILPPHKSMCLGAVYSIATTPIEKFAEIAWFSRPLGLTPMGLLPDTQNCGLRMRWECRERFPHQRPQRKTLVSDPGMHHGTCVTHVPWCMSGSLTCGGGENVPGIPGACATRNFTNLARGPWSISHATTNASWPYNNQ